ncbi:MAG TPA: hypothetical protein VJ865_14570 [Gemmatimonadaceae bacterium]|nr:hypothetical protein [Gemmatimonadaceae bacterium]
MRYVNLRQLEALIPPGWQDRAAAALDSARLADPDDRVNILRQHSELWTDLKPFLAKMSHSKCWYCESREKRSDNAVDHFRPKSRVAENSAHPGYWWLAFHWQNYRYTCTFCNSRRIDVKTSGGKHDHFPLLDETQRAMDENTDTAVEQPLLLDPTNRHDPELLWFIDDGSAVPRYDEAEARISHQRARASIELYHFNHRDLLEARKQLFVHIRNLVNRGTRFFQREETGYAMSRGDLAEVIDDLRELLEDTQELSRAARSMIFNLRDANHKWLDAVL